VAGGTSTEGRGIGRQMQGSTRYSARALGAAVRGLGPATCCAWPSVHYACTAPAHPLPLPLGCIHGHTLPLLPAMKHPQAEAPPPAPHPPTYPPPASPAGPPCPPLPHTLPGHCGCGAAHPVHPQGAAGNRGRREPHRGRAERHPVLHLQCAAPGHSLQRGGEGCSGARLHGARPPGGPVWWVDRAAGGRKRAGKCRRETGWCCWGTPLLCGQHGDKGSHACLKRMLGAAWWQWRGSCWLGIGQAWMELDRTQQLCVHCAPPPSLLYPALNP
jgi:hypothetical protein